jgi:DNA-binding CsgD family transcriptional regulator
MYSYFREESIEHARICRLCKAVAEQGLVCPDLEKLRVGRNKYLALTIEYPQETKDMTRGSERNDNKQLTVKLIEYLRYIAQGLNEKDIAAKLNVSESAVYNRMSRVMDITGCLTCEEVIAYAKEYTENE